MTNNPNKVERLPLTDDYIFKRVFAFEGNESVLKDFLEAILKKDIKKVEIKNPEIIPYEKDEKRGLLDIKAELKYVIGVSAGATNAYSYISKQRGRNLEIMERFIYLNLLGNLKLELASITQKKKWLKTILRSTVKKTMIKIIQSLLLSISPIRSFD